MSRAFVKEDDGSADGRCPKCGNVGQAVQKDTLDHHLLPEARANLSATGSFCQNPICPVIYFDDFERTVTAEDVRTPVYPKDPEAPICACFGLTRLDIDADVAESGVKRCRATVEKSRSPDARCAILSPSGQSCVSEIQKYYQKAKATAETAKSP